MAKLRVVAYKDILELAAEFLGVGRNYVPVNEKYSSPGVRWMSVYEGKYAGKVFMVWDDSVYNEIAAQQSDKVNMIYMAVPSLGISIQEVPSIGADTTEEDMALWDKHWPGWDLKVKQDRS